MKARQARDKDTGIPVCPECQAALHEAETCQEYFHQMLYWENENPDYGDVHHLTVLCYYLQHPSSYSQEGLAVARQLLFDFLENGLSPAQVRQQNRFSVDSGKRAWKVKATDDSSGAYERPVLWTMTAADVVKAGRGHYQASIRAWAQSVHAALKLL